MSKAMKHVQSQESFAALDISEARNDDWMHKLVDHKVFSDIVSTKCEPLRKDKESSSCHEEEFRAILDSWDTYIAYEIECMQTGKAGTCKPTSTTYSEHVFEPSKRMNNYGPPTRFQRRGAM